VKPARYFTITHYYSKVYSVVYTLLVWLKGTTMILVILYIY